MSKKELLDFITIDIDWNQVQHYVLSLFATVVITYVTLFLIRFFISQFFKRTNFIEEKKEQTIESVVRNTSKYISFIIIIMTAIRPFIEIKDLLVAGGVIGIVIGFGAQSAIKDILYGFFFLFEGQFKKGDFVNVNGELDGGTIEDLGFRAVQIRLLSGKLMTISNGEIRKVVNGNIERRRIYESVIVSYRMNPSTIKGLLEEICMELNDKHKEYLKTEKNNQLEEEYHVVGLSSLDSTLYGFKFNIAATVNDTDYINAVTECKELLAQKLFDNQVIFPEQQVFHKTRLNSGS